MRLRITLLYLFLLPSCLQTPTGQTEAHALAPLDRAKYSAPPGVIVQGLIGASVFEEVERSGGTDPSAGGGGDGLKQMPAIGGNWQMPLGGERLQYGAEFGGTLGFQSDRSRVAAGGGGLLIAVDIDLYLFDLYAGPFLSLDLGRRARIYGGLGPLMQYASYSMESEVSTYQLDDTGSGFGLGWYTRLGVEFAISDEMMVGLAGRWIDSRISLSDDLGELDVKGSQIFVSVSTGF